MNQHYPELFRRHDANPILTAKDWPYPVHRVFNPGATLLADGTTLLLCRVEDRRGISHLTAARSANGVDGWLIDPAPTLAPHPDHAEEQWGIEDPRITWLAELGRYAVVYTAYSPAGPGVSLALTEDFRDVRALRDDSAARGQGRRAPAAPDRRVLGDHPPPGRTARARTCGCRTRRTCATGEATR